MCPSLGGRLYAPRLRRGRARKGRRLTVKRYAQPDAPPSNVRQHPSGAQWAAPEAGPAQHWPQATLSEGGRPAPQSLPSTGSCPVGGGEQRSEPHLHLSLSLQAPRLLLRCPGAVCRLTAGGGAARTGGPANWQGPTTKRPTSAPTSSARQFGPCGAWNEGKEFAQPPKAAVAAAPARGGSQRAGGCDCVGGWAVRSSSHTLPAAATGSSRVHVRYHPAGSHVGSPCGCRWTRGACASAGAQLPRSLFNNRSSWR